MGVIFFLFHSYKTCNYKNIATKQTLNKIRCYFKFVYIVINANQVILLKKRKKKVFGQISKYGFYTNNLSKNDINSLSETFKNQTCQYIN